jgi:hypothetical protein
MCGIGRETRTIDVDDDDDNDDGIFVHASCKARAFPVEESTVMTQ